MQEVETPRESASKVQAPSPVARIDAITRTLRALYNYKKPGTYKDVSGPADLNPSYTSLALSASRDLGLTRSPSRGVYDLSPDGIEFCRYLTAGRDEECQAILRRLILNNPLWSEVVAFLRTNEGNPREAIDIAIGVEQRLGKQWSQTMRKSVAEAYTSILGYAGLVKVESGKIISLAGQVSEVAHAISTDGRGFESEPVVVARASAKVLPLPFNSRGTPLGTDYSEFTELRDENVTIRVRKDLESISAARNFLDFVESRLKLSRKSKDDSTETSSTDTS